MHDLRARRGSSQAGIEYGMDLIDFESEWLESDGRGGFASGTAGGIRTRRYHALLLTATTPPTGRIVLVNGFEAWIDGPAGSFPISSQRYTPNVTYPDGSSRIVRFTATPWPSWTFRDRSGTEITQEILVHRETRETVLRWRCVSGGASTLRVRLLLSGRDYHALHRENPAFDMRATVHDGNVFWRPCPDQPVIGALTNGDYVHEPDWYRELLLCPGSEAWFGLPWRIWRRPARLNGISRDDAVMVLRAGHGTDARASPHAAMLMSSELTRRAAAGPLRVAADAIWSIAAKAARSSPAFPGSPTGGATLSSPCAA